MTDREAAGAAGGMVRIDIAELDRELREALANQAGRLGTHSEPSAATGTGGNHDARGARRLRLVQPDERPVGLDR